jgi:hypothetical protein
LRGTKSETHAIAGKTLRGLGLPKTRGTVESLDAPNCFSAETARQKDRLTPASGKNAMSQNCDAISLAERAKPRRGPPQRLAERTPSKFSANRLP